ncbi:cytochrome B [Phaeodactylibacter xiamenensis]|uniref:cytochrome B n=1 Tax=Phaeodactylibacter xiamenensis TaxID=1524460 RepID=UPI0024A8CAF1|nr:cytochrome B [Phaeodactylibacter xiamenensis]
MYNMLKHAHSGLRWLLLAALIYAIIKGFQSWRNGKAFNKPSALIGLILTHVQLVIGLLLYFVYSPLVSYGEGFMKDTITRFYTVEHLVTMLLAIILITIGYSRGKRKADATAAGKAVFVFYLIGLLLILLGIPWPFRGLGAGWF